MTNSSRYYSEDGNYIAVLVSKGFGNGWSSQVEDIYKEFFTFDAGLVDMALSGANEDEVDRYIDRKIGYQVDVDGHHFINDVNVYWVPVGTRFRIEEYDGSEYIITENDLEFVA